MTENTQSDPRPKMVIDFQAEGTQPGSLEVDGKMYLYTIIRAGIAPGLPYGIAFPSEHGLMISEDVPEADRSFIMSHEVREKTSFAGLPEEERCQASLKAELEDVRAIAPARYDDYVDRRRSFFDALVTLYSDPVQIAAVTPQFIQGIQASRDFLHHIAPPETPKTN